jgi:2,4-dienoyl-CoA reductase-like NADH-dependent reductase (Old Yellow Enzyme family)
METWALIESFSEAAARVKAAGFDGVQLHGAHGYLIHQFLLPAANRRHDDFGIEEATGLGTRFLEQIIDAVRSRCGADFPVLVKVSAGDDCREPFSASQLTALIHFLDRKRVDAIEVSYGTMDMPLNIFRGTSIPFDAILRFSPRYGRKRVLSRQLWRFLARRRLVNRVKSFSMAYNLPYAELAREHTGVPVISVGGFRDGQTMETALREHRTDFVALCRPLLCEPDLVNRILENNRYVARCVNCNTCAVMCDSPEPTRCYRKPGTEVAQ